MVLRKPEIGNIVYGIDECSRYSPYMPGQAFRYVEFEPFVIDDIYPDGFVICHI